MAHGVEKIMHGARIWGGDAKHQVHWKSAQDHRQEPQYVATKQTSIILVAPSACCPAHHRVLITGSCPAPPALLTPCTNGLITGRESTMPNYAYPAHSLTGPCLLSGIDRSIRVRVRVRRIRYGTVPVPYCLAYC